MTYEDDLDLARRLRRIAEDPEPQMPVSLYRFVDQVVEGTATADEKTSQTVPTAIRLEGRRPGRSQVKTLAGLAAALIVAIVGGTLLVAWRTSGLAASPSLSPDQWTGLEWRDITATSDGLYAQDPWAQGIGMGGVVSWSGGLAAYGGSGLWTSSDGLTWTKVAGAPELTSLGAIGGKLIGVGWTPHTCSTPASAADNCNWAGGIWTSSDGVNWQSVAVPFTDALVESLTATSKGAVVLTSPVPVAGSTPAGPYVLYATTDGTSWSRPSFPEDVSQATGFEISALREGFLVSAGVPDPAGTMHMTGIDGTDVLASELHWSSPDGVTWSRAQLDPSMDQGRGLGFYAGRLGDVAMGFPYGLHSSDGIHWVKDADAVMTGIGGMLQMMSDGRHVLVSGGWDPIFKVSLGDGRWQTLDQGGEIGSLPGGGEISLLPNGVLYAGGGRLYFGQAVSGTPARGTLHPASTITEPPTPKPTPGTPRPSVTLTQATAWTGVAGVRKLDGGPVGATSVTRWKGGYVAMRNAPASGGLLTVWTSPDGKAWAQLPNGTFGKATTAVCAQDADQVVIATWGGENNVWVSSDGSTWAKNPNGNPPIGDRPMVGNSWGMVAIMDDPQYQLVFDPNWHTVTIPGIDINSIQGVAVAGNRYVAVGHVAGTKAGSTKPAAWWSDDGATWTAATVEDAPGDGFVTVAAGRNGFVATGSATGATAGSTSFWTSADGKTWHRGTAMGPFPAGAMFAGDGTHILGWGPGSDGTLEFWTSLDGQQWTKLAIAGDAAPILLSGSAVRAYLVEDGVLLVTPNGAWFGQAVIGT